MRHEKKKMILLAAVAAAAFFVLIMFMDQVQIRYHDLNYDQILMQIPDGDGKLAAYYSQNQFIDLTKQDLENLKDESFREVDLPKEYKEILMLPGDNFVISVLYVKDNYYLATISYTVHYSGSKRATATMEMKYEHVYTSRALERFVKEHNLIENI